MQFNRPDFSMHYQVVDGLLPEDTLFLHGNLSSNLWWEPAVQEWQKQGGGRGRAVLAEWRGCGNSRAFRGGLDLKTLAADCLALLDYLLMDKVNVVGHSTGGLIALHAMAQEPERFDRAFLLDPVSPEGLELPPEIASAFEQMSRDKLFCGAVILGTIHGGNLSESFRERIVNTAFSVAPEVWRGVPGMMVSPPKLDYARLPHPVLVAHGEKDQVLPKAASARLAEALPQGAFREIPGRGHCTNVEDPALFTQLVNEFLHPPRFPNRIHQPAFALSRG
jgi:pimeloyl-ACP methyl ester carboxylesterase